MAKLSKHVNFQYGNEGAPKEARSMSQTGDWGSGVGKGGGAGGSVREAGGSFGKMEAAHEEQYFRKLQAEQLKDLRKMMEEEVRFHEQQMKQHKQAQQFEDLKKHLDEEIDHHEKSIAQHMEAIDRHKKKIGSIKKQEEKAKDGSDSD